MINFSYLVCTLIFLISAFVKTAYANLNVVITEKHAFLSYELGYTSMVLNKPLRFRQSDGQFEVRIKLDKFPVSAPHCKSAIIARMPSTIETNQEEIAKKKKLFDLIKEVESDRSKTIAIRLDLKPYVKIKKVQPFEGELVNCNVFFAQISDQISL